METTTETTTVKLTLTDCEVCQGTGRKDFEDCPECEGTGRIMWGYCP